MFWGKVKRSVLFVVLAVGLVVVGVKAQESSSLSPTPSPSLSPSTSTIPPINTESLRDPDAFKLDQQIKQATRELLKSTDTSTGENKASYRKTLMKQAIKKYPYVFLGNVLTSSQTSSLDEKLKQYIEKPLTLSNAELGVMHFDDFENHKNSLFEYSLQNLKDHTRFNFYPASSSHMQDGEGAFGGHISGTTLNVNGVALDDDVTARVLGAPQEGGENNDPVPTNVEVLKETSPDAIGGQKIAFILVYPNGANLTNLSSQEEEFNYIFKGDSQTLFKEVSYDKMWLDAENSDVYGWYKIGDYKTASEIRFERDILPLIDDDIDFTRYDRVVIGGWGIYAGWGTVGKTHLQDSQTGPFDASINLFSLGSVPYDASVFIHEFGHNLGVGHAHTWECDQLSQEKNCKYIERSNPFDPMGIPGFKHFNGYFKEVFQWLSPINQSVIDVNQSGTYTLKPLETKDAVVAKISRSGGGNFPIYYLEYRESIGFDARMSAGIYVNWRNKPLETRLIKMNSSNDRLDFELKHGQSFDIKNTGINLTNMGIDTYKGEVIVKIELSDSACRDNDFYVNMDDIYSYEWGENSREIFTQKQNLVCSENEGCTLKRKKLSNLTFTFSLRVKNNNYGCPDVNMSALFDDPRHITFGYYNRFSHWISSNGEETLLTPTVIIPATAPAKIYRVNVSMKNEDTSQQIFSTGRDLKIIDDFQTLEGDLNNDNKVDIFDLVTVAKDFGKRGAGFLGDADKNGVVDIFDLVIVAKNFGKKL